MKKRKVLQVLKKSAESEDISNARSFVIVFVQPPQLLCRIEFSYKATS